MKYQIVAMTEDGTMESQFFDHPAEIAAMCKYVPVSSVGGQHLREELRGQPKFTGLYGPMWGGIVSGQPCVRYEDLKVYEILST